MIIDKTLVAVVTQNNAVLLQHLYDSILKYDAGCDYDFVVIDHDSTFADHIKVLNTIAKKHTILHYPNNRFEVSCDRLYKQFPSYKYYFFMHDDAAINSTNWLKVFIERQKSDFVENIIQGTDYAKLPIGRVGNAHQPWRSFTSILNYPVQCVFLKKYLDFEKKSDPSIFKFADPDRVLITNECMSATNGLPNIGAFKEMQQSDPNKFNSICMLLNSVLPYEDEGIPPRDLYPKGLAWNKMTMLSEFLCSIEPLSKGFRTVGLEGEGYLEQIHGYDNPWGHKYVHHYGAPNMLQFIGKTLNTDPNEVRKNLKNKILLMRIDKMVKEYNERTR